MNRVKGKKIKIILSAVITAAVIAAGLHILGNVLTPPNFNMHIVNDLKKVDASGGKIDMMFIGASRMYHSFIPSVFEEELGIDTVFNFGAANAAYSGTYYQLKDMVERYNPSRVIIGVTMDELTDDEWLRGKLVIWDRLSTGGKLQYFFGGLYVEDWKYTLYAYRFREEITNISYNLEEKARLEATDYASAPTDGFYYGGKGFVTSDYKIPQGHIEINGGREFTVESINSRAVEYLDRCMELCRNRGIEVILVTPPTSMMRIYNMSGYQEVVDYYTEYAEKNGAVFYDLNLLKDREEFLTDEEMVDYNHVNSRGAEIISDIMVQLIKAHDAGEDTSVFFYPDVDSMKADVKRIPAVGCRTIVWEKNEGREGYENALGTAYIQLISMHNDDIIPEYCIEILRSGESEYESLTGWTGDENIILELPADGTFTLRIRARGGIPGEPEAVAEFSSDTVRNGFDLSEYQDLESIAADNALC
ncbi:MAG: hypothetical protein HUJ76_02280 [Parasporobacterium sp.]|nr:hypothetical protein [Parasporobacterium sp.]